MIIDSNSNMVSCTDNPPPYQYLPESSPSDNVPSSGSVNMQSKQPKAPVHPGPSSPPVATLHVAPVPVMPQPRVYHYQNSATGEHLASLLPPDHPEMLCLQRGAHEPRTKFGILGVLAAIVWFPLGIGLCLLDRRVQCKHCGAVLDQGMCG